MEAGRVRWSDDRLDDKFNVLTEDIHEIKEGILGINTRAERKEREEARAREQAKRDEEQRKHEAVREAKQARRDKYLIAGAFLAPVISALIGIATGLVQLH